jgi:hypothetical protein
MTEEPNGLDAYRSTNPLIQQHGKESPVFTDVKA